LGVWWPLLFDNGNADDGLLLFLLLEDAMVEWMQGGARIVCCLVSLVS
jgi:hypothetical protein